MLLTDKIDELIYHNIPENRRVLSSNITNLHQIANYCDANYMQVILIYYLYNYALYYMLYY